MTDSPKHSGAVRVRVSRGLGLARDILRRPYVLLVLAAAALVLGFLYVNVPDAIPEGLIQANGRIVRIPAIVTGHSVFT